MALCPREGKGMECICVCLLRGKGGGNITCISLTTRFVSLQTCLMASASVSYSMSLNSIPGKTSLTRASNLILSEKVSLDRVLILNAWTTSFVSRPPSTLPEECNIIYLKLNVLTFKLFEPVQEKTNNLTQTRLYSHRIKLEA